MASILRPFVAVLPFASALTAYVDAFTIEWWSLSISAYWWRVLA